MTQKRAKVWGRESGKQEEDEHRKLSLGCLGFCSPWPPSVQSVVLSISVLVVHAASWLRHRRALLGFSFMASVLDRQSTCWALLMNSGVALCPANESSGRMRNGAKPGSFRREQWRSQAAQPWVQREEESQLAFTGCFF